MIQSIESQLAQVKLLFGYDAETPTPKATDIPRSSQQQEYLSDAEEAALERQIEGAREDGLREVELIAKAWERQKQALSEAGEERLF